MQELFFSLRKQMQWLKFNQKGSMLAEKINVNTKELACEQALIFRTLGHLFFHLQSGGHLLGVCHF